MEERALRIRLSEAATLVLQFRLHNKEPPLDSLRVLLIPGNPGVPGFYRQFVVALLPLLERLLERRQASMDIQVDVISHAGHAAEVLTEEERRSGAPVYSLNFQIQHKAAYLRRLLAEERERPRTRVVVIAHSIGCLIASKLAAQAEFDRVDKFLFLMPTVHWLEEGLAPFIRRFAIWPVGLSLLGHVADRMPGSLVRYLVDSKMADVDHPEWRGVILDAFCRTVVHNVLYMARTEVKQVRELPLHLYRRPEALSRMFFLFSPDNDSYTPPHLIADLVAQLPEAEVAHLPSFVPHAFVQCTRSINEVASVLTDYLEKEQLLPQQLSSKL